MNRHINVHSTINRQKKPILNSEIINQQRILYGEFKGRIFTLQELHNTYIKTKNFSKPPLKTGELCKSVYITLGDIEKIDLNEKTYKSQNKTSTNIILVSIIRKIKSNKPSAIKNTKFEFVIDLEDKGKFHIEVLESDGSFVKLIQSNLHYEDGCSKTNLIKFNRRVVIIFI